MGLFNYASPCANHKAKSFVSVFKGVYLNFSSTASSGSHNSNFTRFWDKVSVKRVEKSPSWSSDFSPGGLGIFLDQSILKTPNAKDIVLDHRQLRLAHMLAAEWESQKRGTRINSLPLTSTVARAIDRLTTLEQREAAVTHAMTYFDTDAICYLQSRPEKAANLQRRVLSPLHSLSGSILGHSIKTTDGIISITQSPQAHSALRNQLLALSPFQLAGLEKSVLVSKSVLLSLLLVKDLITLKQAVDAARVETQGQLETWGFVEDAHDVEEHDIFRQLGAAYCVSRF